MAKKRRAVKNYLKEIVIGEGQGYERKVKIPRPIGREWRKLIGPLSTFVMKFAEKGIAVDKGDAEELTKEQESKRAIELMEAIGSLWKEDIFEAKYLPAVLGLDNEEGLAYLDESLDQNEVVTAFFEAAMLVVAGSEINEPETKEALKNSQGATQAEK